MTAQQRPCKENEARTMVTGIETTESIGSTWKRKRSRSKRMAALASKQWDKEGAQASCSMTDHPTAAPGPSTVATAAPPNEAEDNPLPAQHEDDSSCSDVSITTATVSQCTADMQLLEFITMQRNNQVSMQCSQLYKMKFLTRNTCLS